MAEAKSKLGIGGPPHIATEPVPVTQVDRHAAAILGRDFLQWTDKQVDVTLEGRGDNYPVVQALARHRQDAIVEMTDAPTP